MIHSLYSEEENRGIAGANDGLYIYRGKDSGPSPRELTWLLVAALGGMIFHSKPPRKRARR